MCNIDGGISKYFTYSATVHNHLIFLFSPLIKKKKIPSVSLIPSFSIIKKKKKKISPLFLHRRRGHSVGVEATKWSDQNGL